MQTLGELGIVGLVLLLAFFGWVFVCGLRAALLSDAAERSRLAAALAGFTVFLLTAGVDWMWQVPALPVAALILACGLLVAGSDNAKPRLAVPWRVGVGFVSLIAIVAIAIPLASLSLTRESQAEARAGDYEAALEDAKSAQNVEPAAAAPRLQQALVLELMGICRRPKPPPSRRSTGSRPTGACGSSARGSRPRTAGPTSRSSPTGKPAT